MTPQELNTICEEWWTGLTAEGQPAEHSEWPYREQGTLPRVEQLAATLSTKLTGSDIVRVSLARGVDGETDVRIELELDGVIQPPHRWRPSEGDLDSGCLLHYRTLAKARSSEALTAKADAVEAAKSDPTDMTFEEVHSAIPALKIRRMELREQLEAIQLVEGDASLVTAELTDIAAKIAGLSIRNDALNIERKAELRALEEAGRG